MPVAGAGAVDLDALRQACVLHRGSKNSFGGGRSTDIAETNEEDAEFLGRVRHVSIMRRMVLRNQWPERRATLFSRREAVLGVRSAFPCAGKPAAQGFGFALSAERMRVTVERLLAEAEGQ